MSKKKATRAKTARGVRSLPAKTLSAKAARGVKGGRKGQHEYMKITLKEVFIT